MPLYLHDFWKIFALNIGKNIGISCGLVEAQCMAVQGWCGWGGRWHHAHRQTKASTLNLSWAAKSWSLPSYQQYLTPPFPRNHLAHVEERLLLPKPRNTPQHSTTTPHKEEWTHFFFYKALAMSPNPSNQELNFSRDY